MAGRQTIFHSHCSLANRHRKVFLFSPVHLVKREVALQTAQGCLGHRAGLHGLVCTLRVLAFVERFFASKTTLLIQANRKAHFPTKRRSEKFSGWMYRTMFAVHDGVACAFQAEISSSSLRCFFTRVCSDSSEIFCSDPSALQPFTYLPHLM